MPLLCAVSAHLVSPGLAPGALAPLNEATQLTLMARQDPISTGVKRGRHRATSATWAYHHSN